MKHLFALLLLVSFFSCKKEEKTYVVSYKIVRSSSAGSDYTVRYTLADGTTQSQGPLAGASWSSGTITDYKPNTYLVFSIESNSGEYNMYVYVNGALERTRAASGGFGELKLEAKTPN